MRLIDAEQTFNRAINEFEKHANEEIKKDADYIVNVRPYEQNGFAIFQEAMASMPTVCDIDAILDEIQAEKQGYPPSADYYKAISKVYEIIIKHTKGGKE